MDIQQLIHFEILAKVKNITRAADQLIMTQSALSKSIARLEDELGVKLFERSRKGVIMNRYGEAFLPYVTDVLKQIEDGKKKLDEMIDPLSGIISIGYIPTLRPVFIPELIRLFVQEMPNLQIQLTQGSTKRLLAELSEGKLDLVFCSSYTDVDGLGTYPFMKEELKLIVPTSHSLAKEEEVALDTLATEDFVHYQQGLALRQLIDDYCKEAGFLPKVTIEGAEDEMIAGLVEAKCGIAIVPYSPMLEQKNITLLAIKEPNCERMIEMAWRAVAQTGSLEENIKQFVLQHQTRLEEHYRKYT